MLHSDGDDAATINMVSVDTATRGRGLSRKMIEEVHRQGHGLAGPR